MVTQEKVWENKKSVKTWAIGECSQMFWVPPNFHEGYYSTNILMMRDTLDDNVWKKVLKNSTKCQILEWKHRRFGLSPSSVCVYTARYAIRKSYNCKRVHARASLRALYKQLESQIKLKLMLSPLGLSVPSYTCRGSNATKRKRCHGWQSPASTDVQSV